MINRKRVAMRRRRMVRGRRLAAESLEARRVLSAMPFGAAPQDTAEFMLGTVAVNVVLLESNGLVDPNTEDWTPAAIAEVKDKVRNGVEWWEHTLAGLNTVHSLDFRFNYTYADNPVPTRYEPISRVSDDYTLWVNEFLDYVGFNTPAGIDEDIRLFNNAQRLALGTNWAFTIFVVNSANDLDGQFAPNGSFRQAFAFAGGQFFVAPSTRPEMTFAHETGHMFWALDEYPGGAGYTEKRGYYNSQNLNAANNPSPGFVQQDSIMASATPMFNAFNNHTSSASTLALIGWRDSDGNGVFDVLDVPHRLTGVGYFDAATGKYRFRGEAVVGTLPNQNSSGLQDDITINTITRAEYRIDGGNWITAANYGTYRATLDLSISVPSGDHTVEIRTVTIDPGTQQLVTASPIFAGTTQRPTATPEAGIDGFLWNDVDGDGQRDPKEVGLQQRIVQIVDGAGQPLQLQQSIDPDDFSDAQKLDNPLPGVTLSVTGLLAGSSSPLSRAATFAGTGTRVFAFDHLLSGVTLGWSRNSGQLRAEFAAPQSYVAIDAIGMGSNSFARLEAYDSSGNLLQRVNSDTLSDGQKTTLTIARGAAEIASIKAFGQGGSSVALDHLVMGPPSAVTTTYAGAYQFRGLPAGSYNVTTIVPAGATLTTPPSGQHNVTVAANQRVGPVEFGILPERVWQNPNNALDVNGDERVLANDVVMVLADLSNNKTRLLPPATDAVSPFPYWDVNGDGWASPPDLLDLLRYLSRNSGAGEPSGAGSSSPSSSPRSSGSTSDSGARGRAEGESHGAMVVPSTADLLAEPTVGATPPAPNAARVRATDALFGAWGDPPAILDASRGSLADLLAATRVAADRARSSSLPASQANQRMERREANRSTPRARHEVSRVVRIAQGLAPSNREPAARGNQHHDRWDVIEPRYEASLEIPSDEKGQDPNLPRPTPPHDAR